MNDDVMNAIRGSVTKLLASDTRVGGPHSTPADVVAVPSTPGAHPAPRRRGDAPNPSSLQDGLEDPQGTSRRANAMAAEIAAEARVRGENERARIATEKADGGVARRGRARGLERGRRGRRSGTRRCGARSGA